jgi:hypothetical protein
VYPLLTFLRRPGHMSSLATVLVLSLGLGFGVAAAYGRTRGDRGPQLPADAQQLLDLVNLVRTQSACPPLKVNGSLAAMAQAQANDMVARGFLSSVNPENQDPVSRASRFGYIGAVTESFAAGLASPSEVVAQWTNTDNALAVPVARRIRTCRMVSIGIGHDTGTAMPPLAAHVWVIALGDH